MLNRKELKEKVPHGGCTIIAIRAGVSKSEVSLYFSNKRNSEKIEMATLQYLAEISQAKKELLDKIL